MVPSRDLILLGISERVAEGAKASFHFRYTCCSTFVDAVRSLKRITLAAPSSDMRILSAWRRYWAKLDALRWPNIAAP